MTTTLVLSPEREAHIAYLKQQEIEVRIDNNSDDIFPVATSSLWDILTEEEQEIFTSLQIEYVNVSQCAAGCGSLDYIYRLPGFYAACKSCLEKHIWNTDFDSLREQTYYSIPFTQLRILLKITNLFPKPDTDIPMCARCNDPLPTNNNDVHNWYQTASDVWLTETTQGSVHRRCSFTCSNCNKNWSHSAGSQNVDADTWCQQCVDSNDELSYCEWGDHYTTESSDDYIYSDMRGDTLCTNCYNLPIECGDCGWEYYENNDHTCEDDSESNYSEYIHSYSYKPRPVFYPTRFEPYYLGMELEVEVCGNETRNDCALEVVNKLGDRVYLKEDGSLSNGFEIVTHPHTLYEYQTNIDWTFLDKLSKMGVRSWQRNSCGLHVHVSRTAFNDSTHAAREAHQVRFNKLIYDNQRQVERLAGRKNNNYATFQDKGKVVRKVKFGNQSNGRYSAVNMEPEHTIEVRVFKGSLRKERILSGIEFVVAAVEYTRNLKIQHKSAPFTWARFVHYVTANSDTYPNLFIIMNETFEKDNDPNGDN